MYAIEKYVYIIFTHMFKLFSQNWNQIARLEYDRYIFGWALIRIFISKSPINRGCKRKTCNFYQCLHIFALSTLYLHKTARI